MCEGCRKLSTFPFSHSPPFLGLLSEGMHFYNQCKFIQTVPRVTVQMGFALLKHPQAVTFLFSANPLILFANFISTLLLNLIHPLLLLSLLQFYSSPTADASRSPSPPTIRLSLFILHRPMLTFLFKSPFIFFECIIRNILF